MGVTITKIHHRANEWVSVEEAAEIMHCNKRTVFNCIKEMEVHEGSRYPRGITSMIGTEKIIDRLVLQDFIRNRKILKNKTLVKRLEPYDPKLQARLLGYYDQPISDDPMDEEKEEAIA